MMAPLEKAALKKVYRQAGIAVKDLPEGRYNWNGAMVFGWA